MEAYAGEEDAASHARFGPTARNRAMYGPAGRAYVYRVYGMHHCLNVVTGPTGRPSAVLVRAVEPIAAVDAMRAARVAAAVSARRIADPGRDLADQRRIGRMPLASLASGPALVAAAFSIDVADTGIDLCAARSPLMLGVDPDAPDHAGEGGRIVGAGPRVGVGYAAAPWDAIPWRFWIDGCDAVSRPRGTRRAAG